MKIAETDFTTFGVVNKESSSTHPIEENFAEVIYIYSVNKYFLKRLHSNNANRACLRSVKSLQSFAIF